MMAWDIDSEAWNIRASRALSFFFLRKHTQFMASKLRQMVIRCHKPYDFGVAMGSQFSDNPVLRANIGTCVDIVACHLAITSCDFWDVPWFSSVDRPPILCTVIQLSVIPLTTDDVTWKNWRNMKTYTETERNKIVHGYPCLRIL